MADDGRAIAIVAAGPECRAALADALSWHIAHRFQAEAMEADMVLTLRTAGALADRIDELRELEAIAPIRLGADDVRLLLEASSAYLANRDTESYQSPEERARILELAGLVDPLFDLAAKLHRADEVLGPSPPI